MLARMKERWNFIRKRFSTYWGTFCLVGALLVLGISGTFAAYTNFSMARRVVSVKDGSIVLFASNLLYTEDKSVQNSGYQNRRISLTGNTFAVEVYNYILADKDTFNNQTIQYTFRVSLVSSSHSPTGYAVLMNDEVHPFTLIEDGTYGVSLTNQTLSGNQASKNSYTIQVPDTDKNGIRLIIEAIPDESSYPATNNKKLASGIVIGNLSLEKNWTGQFIDSRKQGEKDLNPKDYDGFNYGISGYGEGTITLSWNKQFLEINPWFVSDVNASVTNNTVWKSICFPVGGDSDYIQTAAQIQFYWASLSQDISWEDLAGYVEVSFTEKK